MNEFTKGDRYIVKDARRVYTALTEVKVLEIAPSGKYIKFQFAGGAQWVEADKYEIVENLTDKVAKTFQKFAPKLADAIQEIEQ